MTFLNKLNSARVVAKIKIFALWHLTITIMMIKFNSVSYSKGKRGKIMFGGFHFLIIHVNRDHCNTDSNQIISSS